jgi:hypothetical protein
MTLGNIEAARNPVKIRDAIRAMNRLEDSRDFCHACEYDRQQAVAEAVGRTPGNEEDCEHIWALAAYGMDDRTHAYLHILITRDPQPSTSKVPFPPVESESGC